MTPAPQWLALALGLALIIAAQGIARNVAEQDRLAGAALAPPPAAGSTPWPAAGFRRAVLP